MVMCL